MEHTAQQEESRSVTHRGSQLRGGSVEVTAGDDVVFSGAHLQADAGDAQISGKNVAFVSAEESKTSHTRQTQAGAERTTPPASIRPAAAMRDTTATAIRKTSRCGRRAAAAASAVI
ncbi:hemagglutinin repeat-containing protein [Edwardsiella piscicida]|nr:hemagglutinin repeat-containing protein [Edwardsiella piscicida]